MARRSSLRRTPTTNGSRSVATTRAKQAGGTRKNKVNTVQRLAISPPTKLPVPYLVMHLNKVIRHSNYLSPIVRLVFSMPSLWRSKEHTKMEAYKLIRNAEN